MHVTVRLAVAAIVAAALVPLVPGPAWMGPLGAAALLGLAVAVEVRGAPRPALLEPLLTAPESLEQGTAGDVAVLVRNPLSRPLEVALHLAAPPSLGREPARLRAVVAARPAQRVDARIAPSRRGYAEVGPLTVRTFGRWGLAGRQATLSIRRRLSVYPPLPGRRQVGLQLAGRRVAEARRRSSHRGGAGEFDSLREYHPDDELRLINWKATARSPRPISNVLTEERNQQVLVLLDASRTMATSIGEVSRFEHAIDAAVALTELAVRAGDHVGIVVFARDVVAQLPPRGGSSQAGRALDLLFDVRPSLESAAYRKAFASVLSAHRRRALLVLLTDLTEPSAMESLFEAVPALVRRHVVVVATVTDPELARRARAAPSSVDDAYLQAAAGSALVAREQAAARLTRMGATVIDREPGRLAGRLADEYLRVKATRRL